MRIAVIGTGIAGLGAAYALSRRHEVELFEREGRPGGHTHTIEHDGLALDTGFIVHNRPNYPGLVRLFRELGIRTQHSEMSFSVSCPRHRLEYAGRRPLGHAPTRLVREIVRFLRNARATVAETDGQTLGDYVDAHGYSPQFRDHFLVPLTASIWSSGTNAALEFPAGYALRFFDNHGMLGFRRKRWRTVSGGSRVYVAALLERSRATLHVGLPVRAVARTAEGVEVRTDDDAPRAFDGVVVAVHGDEALPLLADPRDDERRILSAFRSTTSETVLHTDERLLPGRGARASWNYRLADCGSPNGHPTITYYLNRLQRLETDRHYCVTLNRTHDIAEQHVIRRISYRHPLYTFESLRAQAELPSLNRGRTAFAGAWQGFGFHEDGLASGLRAAAAFGADW
ncbi:MAG TPA: FAD-dependent oxidoreductase [Gaiellaceae bacterium]|nr:FAD-dependent oxidoreductase [Gaiellaceae bacterium]